ncbi:MAG: ice-binding family protein [Deltaproteobacteria bacterium]|nr:ice-binding family protein [Deltaproteobacteria bacterium]
MKPITYVVLMLVGLVTADNLFINKSWSYSIVKVAGPAPVALRTAGAFAVLTKSGVTDVPLSVITGDIGSSPISGTATLVTCDEVTGTIYSVDAAGPLPCRVNNATLLTAAISDMQIAYADAAGRTLPDFTELGAGQIGGLTLFPGLYKWSSNVLMSTDVTLSGSANDVWIFQIAGNLTQASARKVHLRGGAQAKNVFWQVAGQATLGTTADFKGTILSKTAIVLNTGAVIHGRALAQTAVTLDHSTVTRP